MKNTLFLLFLNYCLILGQGESLSPLQNAVGAFTASPLNKTSMGKSILEESSKSILLFSLCLQLHETLRCP